MGEKPGHQHALLTHADEMLTALIWSATLAEAWSGYCMSCLPMRPCDGALSDLDEYRLCPRFQA